MPEYLAPAVYVEETSFRSKSIEGVGTSTAGFVGLTVRGPAGITPPLLTSFTDFERYYGGVDDLIVNGSAMRNYLALAALAFFNNGGGRLYVSRVLGTGAAAASSAVVNFEPPAQMPVANKRVDFVARFAGGAAMSSTPNANYTVRLIQTSLTSTKRLALLQPPGTMVKLGSALFVIGDNPISTVAADATAWGSAADTASVDILSLTVEVTGPAGVISEHSGLGFHPRHPRYIGAVLSVDPPNASDALTNPVAIRIGSAVTASELRDGLMIGATVESPTVSQRQIALTGGVDATGAPAGASWQAALDQLLGLEDVAIVAAPGASAFAAPTPAAVNQQLIGHAESRRSYRIAVLDTPPNLEIDGVRTLKGQIDSKYAALYYPWIRIANPLGATDPSKPTEIDVPPSGAVCGIYARNDIQRGVFKAPANETVTGAIGLQKNVRFGEQELLNPLGVNCIRALPNRGIRVWGARTLSSDPEWKYVNIRRYFLYLEASIDRGTQWAVFEPNGEQLWANVRETVSDFLYNEWLGGALLGATPKEAFFVRCDRSTMSQNDLDNGRLICLVGVAALKPAEFVIFRVGQKTADGRD